MITKKEAEQNAFLRLVEEAKKVRKGMELRGPGQKEVWKLHTEYMALLNKIGEMVVDGGISFVNTREEPEEWDSSSVKFRCIMTMPNKSPTKEEPEEEEDGGWAWGKKPPNPAPVAMPDKAPAKEGRTKDHYEQRPHDWTQVGKRPAPWDKNPAPVAMPGYGTRDHYGNHDREYQTLAKRFCDRAGLDLVVVEEDGYLTFRSGNDLFSLPSWVWLDKLLPAMARKADKLEIISQRALEHELKHGP